MSNPVNPEVSLKRPAPGEQLEEAHPNQPNLPGDSLLSATTKAEGIERNGVDVSEERLVKRVKVDSQDENKPAPIFPAPAKTDNRDKGVAMIKSEYLIETPSIRNNAPRGAADDDAAEGRKTDDRDRQGGGGGKKNKNKKDKGQNKARQFGSWYDAIKLCNTRANSPEFSPKECHFGDNCKCSHDLRKYLKDGRKGDLTTLGGQCPVFAAYGTCYAGWKCRFVGTHSKEIEREDGRKELVLTYAEGAAPAEDDDYDNRKGVYNVVSTKEKIDLAKRIVVTERSDAYSRWMEQDQQAMEKVYHRKNAEFKAEAMDDKEAMEDNRAQFIDPPFLPSEKRRIYFGKETPVLAPLTTQGNLPFRRMCVELGAQVTYSEMAMSMPLIQGMKSEWALMKAHESEISPPRYNPSSIVQGYDNSKDLKFGAQISASKPGQAMKAAEVMSRYLPHLREINLNCGCPVSSQKMGFG